MTLHIGMAKSKSSASPIHVPSIFVLRLVNGAQLLNLTCDAGAAMAVISPLIKMQTSFNHGDQVLKFIYCR